VGKEENIRNSVKVHKTKDIKIHIKIITEIQIKQFTRIAITNHIIKSIKIKIKHYLSLLAMRLSYIN